MFSRIYHVTHSWLSPGNSLPLTVNGGDGDDDFTVYNDQAPLTLIGAAGNDHFTVRSFVSRVPDGVWYVTTSVKWQGSSQVEGGSMMQRVELRGGRQVRVSLP